MCEQLVHIYFVLQVVKVLVLAVYTTVYGYVQPYRSQLANLLEAAININFLFLLIINATSFFHDDFFIFLSLTESTSSGECAGSRVGIALVSWILVPFYYLPVLGACVTAGVLAVLFIRYNTIHVEWNSYNYNRVHVSTVCCSSL